MIDLVFLHGFFSSPQSRKIQHLLKALPTSVVGEQIGDYHVIDLYPTKKDFEQMTVSSLVRKIGEVIKTTENQCIIIGSSHGGLLALATQQKYPNKVKGLVLLAPAIEYYSILNDRYNLSLWREGGSAPMNYPRFEETSHLSSKYIKDLEKYQNWPSLDLPLLLIHGKKDQVVPVDHSFQYAKRQDDCTEFYPAEGVHNLGNVITQLTAVIINWMSKKII